MDTYTVSAAAKLLSTTRQTIYNHIRKDPDGLSTQTAGGKTVITLQGLALLRERLATAPGPVKTDKTDGRQNLTAQQAEIDRLLRVNQTQADELLSLSRTVAELSSKVSALEDDKRDLKALLDKALDRRLTLFDRVIKRLTAGRADKDQPTGTDR